MQKYVLAAALGLVLVGCSSGEAAEPAQGNAKGSTTVSVRVAAASATKSEDSLKQAATELDDRLAANDIHGAWGLYSQRCQAEIGDIDSYKILMDLHFKGRHPQIVERTVRVNGAMGQVVSVDKDPAAPAHAMDPRTWTFIDGRWVFDHC
ncbi:hypothetical protein [Nocardia nova]|nr:hypothetical protein [Nocardia nova]